MKCKRLGLTVVLVVALACLASFSCIKGGGGDGDGNDDSAKPNFVKVAEGTRSCNPADPNATNITYYSYVKNIGGKGKISMTISSGESATAQYDVTAGTSYIFQATVSCVKQSNTTFTYSAKFPGTANYTDTRTEPGYHHIGAPKNMRLDPK
jgi:hypothetical protein